MSILKFYITSTLLLIFFSGVAQNYKLTGEIIDSNSNPLISATVYAETVKDNKLLNYSITGYSGNFLLDIETSSDKINLFISYNGYETINKEVILNSQNIEMGKIKLYPSEENLGEVVIKAKAPPLIFKGDTLQFNADSFKTRSDANLEDLLKKLPGIEVENDGTITVNGEKVNQILINGTAFFEEDLRIATKNLPKSIIDKVQVMSDKSEVEKFTGKVSSSSKKNINIKLKKDKDKGINAKAILGYGTNDRYQVNTIVNYFNGNQRLSLLGGSNNINNSGFSFDEVYDMIGNSNSLNQSENEQFHLDNINFGGGNGITVSDNVGLNYSNIFKNDSELTADYFYGGSETNNKVEVFRENLLPQDSYLLESTSDFSGSADSHRINIFYKTDIDSTLRFSIQPKFLITKNDIDRRKTQSLYDRDDSKINESKMYKKINGDRKNFSTRVNLIKKLGQKGDYISLTVDAANVTDNSNQEYYSEINNNLENDLTKLNHRISSNLKNQQIDIESEFRKVLTNNLYLDLALRYRNDQEENDKTVNDILSDASSPTYIKDLSSNFDFHWSELRPELGLSYETKDFGINIHSIHNSINLDKIDRVQDFRSSNDLGFMTFGGNFRYQFNKFSKIFIDYKTNNNFPSTYQLQGVQDVSDPINITEGNPFLKPELSHNFRINLTRFDLKKKLNVLLFGQFNLLENPIVYSRTVDESFISKISYLNAKKSNSEILGGFGIIKQFSGNNYSLKINTGAGFVRKENISFVNNVAVNSEIYRIVPRLGVTFKYRDVLEIEPKYKVTFNNAKYNIEARNLNFIVHNLSLRATTYFPKWLTWGNDINYLYNADIEGGLEKFSMIWNMSLGVDVLKNQGSLKLTAYDLLNQNSNVERITNSDYIENIQNTVLNRYFMLSFSYNLNTMEN